MPVVAHLQFLADPPIKVDILESDVCHLRDLGPVHANRSTLSAMLYATMMFDAPRSQRVALASTALAVSLLILDEAIEDAIACKHIVFAPADFGEVSYVIHSHGAPVHVH